MRPPWNSTQSQKGGLPLPTSSRTSRMSPPFLVLYFLLNKTQSWRLNHSRRLVWYVMWLNFPLLVCQGKRECSTLLCREAEFSVPAPNLHIILNIIHATIPDAGKVSKSCQQIRVWVQQQPRNTRGCCTLSPPLVYYNDFIVCFYLTAKYCVVLRALQLPLRHYVILCPLFFPNKYSFTTLKC